MVVRMRAPPVLSCNLPFDLDDDHFHAQVTALWACTSVTSIVGTVHAAQAGVIIANY